MKLAEIQETKRDFVNKLKDPIIGEVEQQFIQLQKHLRNHGWMAVMYGNAPGVRKLVVDHDPNAENHLSMWAAEKQVKNCFISNETMKNSEVEIKRSIDKPKNKGVEMGYDITWEVQG